MTASSEYLAPGAMCKTHGNGPRAYQMGCGACPCCESCVHDHQHPPAVEVASTAALRSTHMTVFVEHVSTDQNRPVTAAEHACCLSACRATAQFSEAHFRAKTIPLRDALCSDF